VVGLHEASILMMDYPIEEAGVGMLGKGE